MKNTNDYINGIIDGLKTIDSELSSDQVIRILESIKAQLENEDKDILVEVRKTIEREFSKRPVSTPTFPTIPSAPMPMWPSQPFTDDRDVFTPGYKPTEIIC